MEEKILVTLPKDVADYIQYMKDKNYTLIGALQITNANLKDKILMTEFLNIADNQEKFARAWLDGYKVEEKNFIVKFKGFSNIYCYLNYARNEKIFSLSSVDESAYFKTKFTKKFLEENGFDWVFNCEGVHIIEVEND